MTTPTPAVPGSNLVQVRLADLRAGQVLRLGTAASIQFDPPINFRLIRVMDQWTDGTYEPWCWLTGYELDHHGNALRQRAVYVQHTGLFRYP